MMNGTRLCVKIFNLKAPKEKNVVINLLWKELWFTTDDSDDDDDFIQERAAEVGGR